MLVGDLLEQIAETIEDSSGHHEFVLAEGPHCGTEARLEARPALLDQSAATLGERGEHHPPVAVRTLALD